MHGAAPVEQSDVQKKRALELRDDGLQWFLEVHVGELVDTDGRLDMGPALYGGDKSQGDACGLTYRIPVA